jgi:hypothetical protein
VDYFLFTWAKAGNEAGDAVGRLGRFDLRFRVPGWVGEIKLRLISAVISWSGRQSFIY